jgi:hypothetical protein
VHRGPYAAFAVAEAGVRPGLLIDQLEQALLLAEESRTKRDGLRAPEPASAQPAGPRTTLHPTILNPPTPPPEPSPASARPRPVESATADGASPPSRPPARPAPDVPEEAASATEAAPPSGHPDAPATPREPEGPKHEKPKLMTTPVTPDRGADDDPDEGGEVDRVLLAQEFSGLLQDPASDDEASS